MRWAWVFQGTHMLFVGWSSPLTSLTYLAQYRMICRAVCGIRRLETSAIPWCTELIKLYFNYPMPLSYPPWTQGVTTNITVTPITCHFLFLSKVEDALLQRCQHHSEFVLGLDFSLFNEGQMVYFCSHQELRRMLVLVIVSFAVVDSISLVVWLTVSRTHCMLCHVRQLAPGIATFAFGTSTMGNIMLPFCAYSVVSVWKC